MTNLMEMTVDEIFQTLDKEKKMEVLKQHLLTSASQLKPIVSDKLESFFGISKVELMDLVRSLRRKGTPVVATSSGYYIGNKIQDVKIIKDDMVKRIKSMVRTVNEMCQHYEYSFDVVFFFERKKKETNPNQISLLEEIAEREKDESRLFCT